MLTCAFTLILTCTGEKKKKKTFGFSSVLGLQTPAAALLFVADAVRLPNPPATAGLSVHLKWVTRRRLSCSSASSQPLALDFSMSRRRAPRKFWRSLSSENMTLV
ncbi:hypothetical protein QYF36_009693 [Acer negundo]|nr:hypothetical protein QYF36_009693 [Acer negundo]